MENKKIAAIMLIIAITLSAVGIVYAHWSDTATINGEIKMGTLTLAFTTTEGPVANEYYHNLNPPPDWLPGEAEGKDVGSCSAHYEDLITDKDTGKPGYKTLVINITNAYPQYAVHTTFIAHNIGTVPLFIYGVSLVGEKKDHTGAHVFDLILDWWVNTTSGHIEGDIYEDRDSSGTVSAGDLLVMNFQIVDTLYPLQLDPCQSDKEEIDIDFKQEAEQCHTYTLTFSLLAVQWNKLSEISYPKKA
jgi:predicted ribosomally synthesized peptide with SipW-like signal peptide